MPGGVNLIPQSKLLARRRGRRVRAWCTAGLIYVAAVAVVWLGGRLLGRDEYTALANEINRLQREIEEDRQAVAQLRPRLDAALAALAANQSVGDQPDWALLLSLLAEGLGEDAVLSACELSQIDTAQSAGADVLRRYDLRLVGLARSQAIVLDYVRTLEGTLLFDSVKLIDTKPEPFGDGSAIGFRIECVLADRMEVARR